MHVPSTGWVVLWIWVALLALFVLWAIILPAIIWRVRKFRSDRRWVAEYRWARGHDFELPGLWADFQTGRLTVLEHGQRLVAYTRGMAARDEIRRLS